MPRSTRRPLVAGVLLLVLALAVSGCASNVGANLVSTATPASATGATSAPLPTEQAATTAPLATEPVSATVPAATEPVSPTVAATEPVSATAAGAAASPLATPAGSEAMATAGANGETGASPLATGTVTTTAPAATSGTPASQPAGGGAATMGAGGISSATYTAVEYSFQGPDQLPAGWTQITLDNQGKAKHDLQLYSIDAGKTLQDVTQALAGSGPPDWAHAWGGITAAPGAKATYTVDLLPGNYILLSFGDNPQGPPDAAKGMLKMVTVTGAASAAGSVTLPQPDVTINMVDYHFEITGTLKSGSQTVLLTNSGTELHEAQVLQLKQGTTFEQFQKVLMQGNGPMDPSQIPATLVWGMTLSPKASAYSTVNLAPGDYAVVCFIPSVKNGGKPHYMLGMMSSVTVK